MINKLVHAWLPPWPQVPPRLWLTGVALVVVSLSLSFNREIWPQHLLAAPWSRVLLGVLLQAAGIQIIAMLRAWREACAGPGWVRLLLWCGVMAVGLGITVLLAVAFLFTCFNLGYVLQS